MSLPIQPPSSPTVVTPPLSPSPQSSASRNSASPGQVIARFPRPPRTHHEDVLLGPNNVSNRRRTDVELARLRRMRALETPMRPSGPTVRQAPPAPARPIQTSRSRVDAGPVARNLFESVYRHQIDFEQPQASRAPMLDARSEERSSLWSGTTRRPQSSLAASFGLSPVRQVSLSTSLAERQTRELGLEPVYLTRPARTREASYSRTPLAVEEIPQRMGNVLGLGIDLGDASSNDVVMQASGMLLEASVADWVRREEPESLLRQNASTSRSGLMPPISRDYPSIVERSPESLSSPPSYSQSVLADAEDSRIKTPRSVGSPFSNTTSPHLGGYPAGQGPIR